MYPDPPSTQRLPVVTVHPPPRGRGTSILFRHHPGGVVTATSRGFTAVGTGEREALAELARLIRAARAPARGGP